MRIEDEGRNQCTAVKSDQRAAGIWNLHEVKPSDDPQGTVVAAIFTNFAGIRAFYFHENVTVDFIFVITISPVKVINLSLAPQI